MKKSFHHFIFGLSFVCALLLSVSLIEPGDPLNSNHILFSTWISPAYGQVAESIDITTDRISYSEGDTIIVSGQVSEILFGFAVNIQVLAPNGNVVSINQVMVGSDKKFSSEILVGGPLWKSEGDYTVKAFYGNENLTDEISISIGGSSSSGPVLIEVEGTDFMLNYSITGGVLVSIVPDTDASTLIVAIIATSDGEFIITLPRELIDSKKAGGHDSNFYVLVDGEETEFVEQTRSTDRTLQISFPAGAEEIEFIGNEMANTRSGQSSGSGSEEVENKPPEIVLVMDQEVRVGETITFDASGSSDSDGTVVKYEWWFGDGSYRTGMTPSHIYSSAGSKEVKIGITDDDGLYVESVYDVKVLPRGGNSSPDLTLIIVGIIVAVVAGGAGLAIAKSRKSSKTITKTVSDFASSEKGRKCNVCGTIIPEGKNVCPNCGDTYS